MNYSKIDHEDDLFYGNGSGNEDIFLLGYPGGDIQGEGCGYGINFMGSGYGSINATGAGFGVKTISSQLDKEYGYGRGTGEGLIGKDGYG